MRGSALVTGAARRIGAEIARELHRCGFDVLLHYRGSAHAAQALAAEFEAARAGSAQLLQADLRDAAAVMDLAARVDALCGDAGLAALVNNASTFYATRLGTIEPSDWEELMGSNLRGPLFLGQGLAPALRRANGSLVNIIDVHADGALRNHALYCAAKAGLASLTRSFALEMAPQVRVNGVAPGAILWPEPTPGREAENEALLRERREMVAEIPLRRTGEAGDIARAVRFLVVDASYMTGQILPVDGGWRLVPPRPEPPA